MGILDGKKGVIFGLANKNSLAWHIARVAHDQGARFALGVASERFRDKTQKLADELEAAPVVLCDVTSDESIHTAFEEIGEAFPQLDFLVHAIAFADRADLEGRFDPLWPPEVLAACLDARVAGGSIRYLLVRQEVTSRNPCYLYLPSYDRAMRAEVECGVDAALLRVPPRVYHSRALETWYLSEEPLPTPLRCGVRCESGYYERDLLETLR